MTTARPFNRRDFMLGAGAAALALPEGVRAASEPANPVFAWGVASGDPLADRVILWTRVNPALGNSVPVVWELALDAGFTQTLRRGRVIASVVGDHTVKVDALGLPANTRLYYRFSTGGRSSAIGATRTLPVGPVSQVKLAVFSCSNFPAGHFHAYADAATLPDVDVALHLGDYIYEYGRGGYASANAASLGREVQPAGETVSLADYRARYALYRSDPALQALHAALPWICVWDDHELTNDAWMNGAENHQEATEGPWAARRAAAVRAYHEWLPIRAPLAGQPERIYRSFAFGNLVDLHMLDTRLIGREQQLSYASFMGANGFDGTGFANAMANPKRQLLGAEQTAWLGQRLASTQATWTVLGQQVLMGRMNIPAPVVLGQIGFGAYSALLGKAATAPASLTATEQAVLAQPAIPYNLDAWDGYAAARETVLGTARALNKNLVVLSGDTHNAWASDLADLQGNPVGVEFATPGVTSPGLETYFPNEAPAAVAAGLAQLIGPLVWAETASRGYMVVTATPTECRCDWRFVSSILQPSYTVHSPMALRTLPGAGARQLVGV